MKPILEDQLHVFSNSTKDELIVESNATIMTLRIHNLQGNDISNQLQININIAN